MLLLVTGLSCSGKSSVSKYLENKYPNQVTTISMDWFYKDLEEYTEDYNFDRPDAFDWERLESVVEWLVSGTTDVVMETRYNYATHRQEQYDPYLLSPKPIIVVEGILPMHSKKLLSMCNALIYVHAPIRECFERREIRDVEKRGKRMLEILYSWESHVVPTFKKYIEPFKNHEKTIVINNFDEKSFLSSENLKTLENKICNLKRG